MSKETSTYWFIRNVNREAKVITKMTAPLIPTAVDILLETPKNGQIPRNCAKIMLFTKMAEINIIIYSIINYFMLF